MDRTGLVKVVQAAVRRQTCTHHYTHAEMNASMKLLVGLSGSLHVIWTALMDTHVM